MKETVKLLSNEWNLGKKKQEQNEIFVKDIDKNIKI